MDAAGASTHEHNDTLSPMNDWPCQVFVRLISHPGTNRIPDPCNLIRTIDFRTSCRLQDNVVSEDIIESINMSPSIDRFSIEVRPVIRL